MLASHVVTAPAFSLLKDQQVEEAKQWIDRAEYVIDTGAPVGEQNAGVGMLRDYISGREKKVLTAEEAFEKIGMWNAGQGD